MKKSLIKILIFFAAIFGTFSIYLLVSNNSVYAADHTPHDGIEDHGFNIAKWDDDDSLPSFDGEYYLTKDVTLTERWRPGNQVKLCLNGHCIKLAGQGSVIEFRGSSFDEEISLSIYDCSEVEHKYWINEEGLAIVDDTLTENYSTFKGGYLTGGNCGNGGCIDLTHGPENKSNLYMRGVNILGNKVTENGAGIYYKYSEGKKCTISLENVSIFGNVAGGKGAGIYQEASNSGNSPALTLNNVNISNNRSGVMPAGIYEESSLAVKGNVYVYDNKVYNDENKDGLESDIIVNHANQSKFSVAGKLEEKSKIGYSLVNPSKIFDYYKVFDENDSTKNNDADPSSIFISNNFQELEKDGVDLSIIGVKESYRINQDDKPHTIYLPKNFDAFKKYIKFGEKEGTYDLDVAPEFTEVGEYTIYYIYEASCFDLPVTGKQVIIIDKRLPLLPTGLTNLYYTGDKQELVEEPENSGATFQYKLQDGYWSSFIPKGLEIGEYTIYVRAVGDDDHADCDVELKATIIPADKTSLIAKIDEATAYRDEINENYKKIAADLNKEILLARTKEIIDVVTADEIKTAEDDLDAALTKAKEDVSSVNAVIDLIDAIGDVAFNDESKAKIDAARAAYDALIEIYKVHVSNYETLTNAEGLYESLKSDDEAAKSVIAAIDSIGEVTLDSKSKIDEVKLAYNVLTDSQKALVTNYETLTNAENTYLKMSASKDLATPVENEINDIGIVYLNEESKAKIDSARVAYDALADDVKPFVSNYETLTSAEARYEELVNNSNLAKAVEDAINAIGEVTIDSKDKIESARTSYDALNDEQKMLVLNLEVLTTAEAKFAVILINKGKAEAVDAKIDEIGAVTYTDECKEKIDTAKASYNILTAEQKAFVTKLETLTNAEKKYTNVDYAYKVINSIGSVELTDEFRTTLNNARNIYDALTDDEKALITNLNRLTNAEADYQQLSSQRTANFLLIVGIVGGVLLLIILVIVYVLFFFVFNSWTLIKYKKKRVFRIGTKNGKVRLLCRNFKIIYRDEADIFKHND